jgi:hypothetical protein
MNGNLCAMAARNGPHLNVSQPTIKTVSKKKRRNSSGIGTEPEFAIGQRALLVQSPAGVTN